MQSSRFGPSALEGRDKPSALKERFWEAMLCYFWPDVVFCMCPRFASPMGNWTLVRSPGSRKSINERRYCFSSSRSQYCLASSPRGSRQVVSKTHRHPTWYHRDTLARELDGDDSRSLPEQRHDRSSCASDEVTIAWPWGVAGCTRTPLSPRRRSTTVYLGLGLWLMVDTCRGVVVSDAAETCNVITNLQE